jgi:hypothetical protein
MTRKAILCTFISLSLSSRALFAQGRGEPPGGWHGAPSRNDFVLVAIATGVILQLLLNH